MIWDATPEDNNCIVKIFNLELERVKSFKYLEHWF